MFVAGVEGCRAPEGWVCFKVEVPSLITSAEVIDLPSWLRNRPSNLSVPRHRYSNRAAAK